MPAEHPNAQKNSGMSDDELAALRFATQSTSSALIQALTLAGKYNWQAFGSDDTSVSLDAASAPSTRAARGPAMLGGPTKANCASFMREYCQPAYQGRPMLLKMQNTAGNDNQTVAAFLVTRPPYAYLG